MSTNNPITRPNDNAFPTTGNGPTDGLTKREHFAAVALQGMLAAESRGTNYPNAYERAKVAVWQADALIKALNQ